MTDTMTSAAPDDAIARTILAMTAERGPDKSICPSEVARALAPEWRPLLARVRQVAARLSTDGRIDILRHGRPVPAAELRGVVRLRARVS